MLNQLKIFGAVFSAKELNNILYLGGSFISINDEPRLNFAAIDLSNGKLLDLEINFDYGINDIEVFGDKLAIGGYFNSVNIEGFQYNNCSGFITYKPSTKEVQRISGITNPRFTTYGVGGAQRGIRKVIYESSTNTLYAGGNFWFEAPGTSFDQISVWFSVDADDINIFRGRPVTPVYSPAIGGVFAGTVTSLYGGGFAIGENSSSDKILYTSTPTNKTSLLTEPTPNMYNINDPSNPIPIDSVYYPNHRPSFHYHFVSGTLWESSAGSSNKLRSLDVDDLTILKEIGVSSVTNPFGGGDGIFDIEYIDSNSIGVYGGFTGFETAVYTQRGWGNKPSNGFCIYNTGTSSIENDFLQLRFRSQYRYITINRYIGVGVVYSKFRHEGKLHLFTVGQNYLDGFQRDDDTRGHLILNADGSRVQNTFSFLV